MPAVTTRQPVIDDSEKENIVSNTSPAPIIRAESRRSVPATIEVHFQGRTETIRGCSIELPADPDSRSVTSPVTFSLGATPWFTAPAQITFDDIETIESVHLILDGDN